MSAVTVRASAHTQVHHTRINLLCLQTRKTWQTVRTMVLLFWIKGIRACKVRFVGQITDCKADDPADKLYDGLKKLICAVIDDYGYLITK